MEYKLELVLLPVADVDRAKAFYSERCGFHLDVDTSPAPGFRVVQLTPPGSACSITIGTGLLDTPPGSVRGLHLVVADIEAARAELVGRGVEVSPIRHFTGDAWAGVAAALAAGIATGALHALVTVVARADQITSGLGINLLAAGLTKFTLTQVFHSSSNSARVVGLPSWDLAGLANLPGVGQVLTTPLVLITVALVLGGQWLLFRSVFGLRLRSIGERPEAAATLGLSVRAYRTAGVLVSGALAGLAGAWLASEQHSFTDGMTGGRGYIALAAM
ncbi:hypothetical protein HGA89_04245, partial [bacterium]|nr:hypothetical protein [bacterium]